MPKANDLPKPLARLARRQAIRLSDAIFHSDVDRLIRILESLLNPNDNDLVEEAETRQRKALKSTEDVNAELTYTAKRSRTLRVFADDQIYIVKFEFHYWAIQEPSYHLWLNDKKIFEGNMPEVNPTEIHHVDFSIASARRIIPVTVKWRLGEEFLQPVKAFRLEVYGKTIYDES